jgi:hypothetical protein
MRLLSEADAELLARAQFSVIDGSANRLQSSANVLLRAAVPSYPRW